MNNYRGIEYLRRKLSAKRGRVLLRYKYYEMHMEFKDPGPVVPPDVSMLFKSTLGWCAKAVDALADRLVFRGFKDDNFNLSSIYEMNSPDILYDSAILSALVSSCCFIYISPGEDGVPRLQVIDGGSATGIIDPITGLLTEGYAVLKWDDEFPEKPVQEAYFTAGRIDYYETGVPAHTLTHSVEYPLLVPIIHRPDAARPFGHSRISRSCMYFQEYASRTLVRSDVSAEFYSVPQKYLVGTDPYQDDADRLGSWPATISSMLQITKDDDGDRPTVGQFQQQSMTPYIEQLRLAASGFAGETGLTLDDLGFPTENPSSAEAIKAAHENLRTAARKAQRCFGSGFLNAGYLAACLRDGIQYQRRQLCLTTPKWEPIFEPDAAMLSGVGDALIKIQQAFPNYLDEDGLHDLVGF